MITIDALLDELNLSLAMHDLTSRRNSCGIDNIHISDFALYWENNKNIICDKIRNGLYVPDIILEKENISYNGEHEIISELTCTDRLLLKALEQLLRPECERIFFDCSHAYRNERSEKTAVKMSANYISNDRPWLAEIDINHLFDSIAIDKMEESITSYLELDPLVNKLIKSYLHCKIERNGKLARKQCGLVKDSPISPLLSNIYLNSIDSKMEYNHYAAVRFADNIRIYTETDDEAENAFNHAVEWISQIDLDYDKEKSGIYSSLCRGYLGYFFEKDSTGDVIVTRERKSIQYDSWHYSSIQWDNHNYHIINDGILTQKDYTVLFENEDGKRYLPSEVIDSINIYSDVNFSTQFFNFLADRKLRLSLFDRYGNCLGFFNSSEYTSSGKTMLKQAAIYLDESKRLEYARKIVVGEIHNIRANLRYYRKQKEMTEFSAAVEELSKIISSDVNKATNLDTLMLVEARSRQIYYSTFNFIISNPNFKFDKRTRNPPKDPLNAMISFGNVFLYNKLATEIYKTSLDIRIGFLHSTNTRIETLNLDIAELFKPIIIDRAIFTLINRRMISSEDHFDVTADDGVYLNREGKKIFINEIEKKMYQMVQFNGYQRTYEFIMREEVQKILHSVIYDQPYRPYKYTT